MTNGDQPDGALGDVSMNDAVATPTVTNMSSKSTPQAAGGPTARPTKKCIFSADAVEALQFLMAYCERIGQYDKAKEYAQVLQDTGGLERPQADRVIQRSAERGFH